MDAVRLVKCNDQVYYVHLKKTEAFRTTRECITRASRESQRMRRVSSELVDEHVLVTGHKDISGGMHVQAELPNATETRQSRD